MSGFGEFTCKECGIKILKDTGCEHHPLVINTEKCVPLHYNEKQGEYVGLSFSKIVDRKK